MQNILNGLSLIMDSFGAAIVVPVVLFVLNLIMKVPGKKAFQSALNAGIGLTGFNLLVGAYTPIVTPVVQRMVATTGVNLNILDTGWQATSIVAYSTQVGMIFLGLGLLIQVLLFVLKFTDVFFPSDLWNNYSYMLWGSMLYVVTGNVWLSIGLMVLINVYTMVFAEGLSRRWSTYYGYPRTTIVASHALGSFPLAVVMNHILNKLGADKVKWDTETLQKRLGALGEPTTIGFILGLLLGLAGNVTRLDTLEGWGESFTVGIATATVMAVFPKIADIFASAFKTLTDASKGSAKSDDEDKRVWYLAINDAAGYGEPATILTSLLLIPIIIILAIVLPGNQALPLVDLVALPYMMQVIVSISNGNIFKSLISGTLYLVSGLYLVTVVAPIFTEVALSVGVNLPEGAVLIFSLTVLTNMLGGLLFLVFMTQNTYLIGLSVILFIALYIVFKKNKEDFLLYLEEQAK
ncbi:PTS system IIC component, Gat family (TC 4.A.5) [Alkalibacterium putridalgicola]|uniref:PTS galactitol transporter subunit IIC n=1 Tax=Alkalibacterium putridalgicola TaxID=426703 RepID=A0A1H7W2H5_9LACT|nr:PTS galactitol transporter subunit IIC [Alkalibacterium putridalgicola]SEM15309.1 PTS system IIC component, Gat family (TC 4.A.5) [Alkalibacterium putridalgicola]